MANKFKILFLSISFCAILLYLPAQCMDSKEESDFLQKGHFLKKFSEGLDQLAEIGGMRIYYPSQVSDLAGLFPEEYTTGIAGEIKSRDDVPKVVCFDVKVSKKILTEFKKTQEKFKNMGVPYEPRIVYHKTQPRGIDGVDNFSSIFENNFCTTKLRKEDLVFGRGFYFTMKCLPYWGSVLYEDSYIISYVLEGKKYIYVTKDMTTHDNGPIKEGYNSHYGHGAYGTDELVIADPTQILPIGIAHTNKEKIKNFGYMPLEIGKKPAVDDEVYKNESTLRQHLAQYNTSLDLLKTVFPETYRYNKQPQ